MDDEAPGILEFVEANRLDLDSVLDTLYGPVLPPAKGGGRDLEQGMEHKVDYLYHRATNGGIPAKMSKRGQIQVALIAAMGTIFAAFVGGLFGLFAH